MTKKNPIQVLSFTKNCLFFLLIAISFDSISYAGDEKAHLNFKNSPFVKDVYMHFDKSTIAPKIIFNVKYDPMTASYVIEVPSTTTTKYYVSLEMDQIFKWFPLVGNFQRMDTVNNPIQVTVSVETCRDYPPNVKPDFFDDQRHKSNSPNTDNPFNCNPSQEILIVNDPVSGYKVFGARSPALLVELATLPTTVDEYSMDFGLSLFGNQLFRGVQVQRVQGTQAQMTGTGGVVIKVDQYQNLRNSIILAEEERINDLIKSGATKDTLGVPLTQRIRDAEVLTGKAAKLEKLINDYQTDPTKGNEGWEYIEYINSKADLIAAAGKILDVRNAIAWATSTPGNPLTDSTTCPGYLNQAKKEVLNEIISQFLTYTLCSEVGIVSGVVKSPTSLIRYPTIIQNKGTSTGDWSADWKKQTMCALPALPEDRSFFLNIPDSNNVTNRPRSVGILFNAWYYYKNNNHTFGSNSNLVAENVCFDQFSNWVRKVAVNMPAITNLIYQTLRYDRPGTGSVTQYPKELALNIGRLLQNPFIAGIDANLVTRSTDLYTPITVGPDFRYSFYNKPVKTGLDKLHMDIQDMLEPFHVGIIPDPNSKLGNWTPKRLNIIDAQADCSAMFGPFYRIPTTQELWTIMGSSQTSPMMPGWAQYLGGCNTCGGPYPLPAHASDWWTCPQEFPEPLDTLNWKVSVGLHGNYPYWNFKSNPVSAGWYCDNRTYNNDKLSYICISGASKIQATRSPIVMQQELLGAVVGGGMAAAVPTNADAAAAGGAMAPQIINKETHNLVCYNNGTDTTPNWSTSQIALSDCMEAAQTYAAPYMVDGVESSLVTAYYSSCMNGIAPTCI